MLIEEKNARELTCPLTRIREEEGDVCRGTHCMAWREVNDARRGKLGYCGLAGTPPAVLNPLIHKAIADGFNVIAAAGAKPSGLVLP